MAYTRHNGKRMLHIHTCRHTQISLLPAVHKFPIVFKMMWWSCNRICYPFAHIHTLAPRFTQRVAALLRATNTLNSKSTLINAIVAGVFTRFVTSLLRLCWGNVVVIVVATHTSHARCGFPFWFIHFAAFLCIYCRHMAAMLPAAVASCQPFSPHIYAMASS